MKLPLAVFASLVSCIYSASDEDDIKPGGLAPTEQSAINQAPAAVGGGGDTRFHRWGREHDSFHGECDLVMVHSDQFNNGAGFDLHVRTTIQDYFSYMSTVAIRVGEDVLELHREHFYLNDEVFTPVALPLTFGDELQYTISIGEVEGSKNANKHQYYKVDLHEGSTLVFKFDKKFLTMEISGYATEFSDAVGLLGEFRTGEMISRDGILMTDFEAYGFEWQVSPEDKILFREARSPQLPYERCRMPSAARPSRRRLRKSNLVSDSQ